MKSNQSSEPKAAVPRRPFRKRRRDGRLADLLPLLAEIDRLRDQLHEATMALFNTVNATGLCSNAITASSMPVAAPPKT